MYLRGNWSSVCPALLCNPRRSQVAPGILYYILLDGDEMEEFNDEPSSLAAMHTITEARKAILILPPNSRAVVKEFSYGVMRFAYHALQFI